MPRYLPHVFRASLAGTLLAFLLSAAAVMARGQEPVEPPLLGRLATVEPAARRIAVLPDGQANLIELILDDAGEVRQEDRELTLSELVILVGRRVSIRYRLENDRRVAQSVIVEPEGSVQLRVPPKRPSLQRSAPPERRASDSGPARTVANRRSPSALWWSG